jgi:hypothetical protein
MAQQWIKSALFPHGAYVLEEDEINIITKPKHRYIFNRYGEGKFMNKGSVKGL